MKQPACAKSVEAILSDLRREIQHRWSPPERSIGTILKGFPCGPSKIGYTLDALRAVLPGSIVPWEDSPGRVKQDVLDLIDAAIEYRRASVIERERKKRPGRAV